MKNILHVIGELSEEDVDPECLAYVGAGDGPHRDREENAAPGHALGSLCLFITEASLARDSVAGMMMSTKDTLD